MRGTFGFDTPYKIAEQILTCVCSALAENSPGGCPGRSCVVPGQLQWECEPACEGGEPGQLAVELVSMWDTREFPSTTTHVQGIKGCPPPGATTAAEFLVTVLRCAPHGEGPCPPSCACLAEVSQLVYADAAVLRNAITCCLPKTGRRGRGRRFVPGKSEIVGPQGGCVGVTQPVTVAMPRCGPDCDEVVGESSQGDADDA